MYNLKGFIKIESLINNAPGLAAPIGELSTWSLTFSKEHGEYFNTLYPGYSLVSFSSTDSVSGSVSVPSTVADHVLEIANFIITYANTQGAGITRQTFNDDLIAHFNGRLDTLNFGEFVNNGTINVPSWISWINPLLPSNTLKIWFSDVAFSRQYDNFEIVVIPPVTNVDDFFLPTPALAATLNARTISTTMDLIQAAKAGNPETVIRTNTYDYINLLQPSNTISTSWSVLIYGAGGDNIDSIKDAITTYILAHSTHTLAEWTAILPSLFRRTEFTILPRWDKYAIPNMTIQTGIYSPIMGPAEMLSFVKTKLPLMPSTHIDSYLNVVPSTFRSLSLAIISNPQNLGMVFAIKDLFPDYINISTGSTDFNRMDINTQDWVNMVESLLIVAENVTPFTDVPPGTRKVTRNGILYVAKVYANIQYLVAAKSSY